MTATSGDRVADIRPMGRLQTVEVEVEPDTGVHDDEHQEKEEVVDEKAKETEEKEDITPVGDQEQPADNDNPPESPKEESPKEAESIQVLATPPSTPSASSSSLPYTSPQPTARSMPAPRGGASVLTNSAVAEGLDEAARRAGASSRKKTSKSRPLSMKDLMPLHQDVGKSTGKLAEPATPDFKATPQWVRMRVCH